MWNSLDNVLLAEPQTIKPFSLVFSASTHFTFTSPKMCKAKYKKKKERVQMGKDDQMFWSEYLRKVIHALLAMLKELIEEFFGIENIIGNCSLITEQLDNPKLQTCMSTAYLCQAIKRRIKCNTPSETCPSSFASIVRSLPGINSPPAKGIMKTWKVLKDP
ncbi:hypothetical protein TURU_090900 [Turdus rufiventris]|nr:hypothetical protein TURU_090900 [Turdus rufiventris]